VERIEISRGSQAVQFGGSALGGVINVVPRAPKQRDLFGVSVNGRSAFDGAVNAMRHSGLIDLGGQDVALIAGGSSVGSERPVTPGESDTVTDGNYRSASGWFNSRAQLGDSAMLRVRGELNNNSDITLLSRPPDSSSEQAVGGGAEVQAPQYRRSLLSAELSGNNDGALIDSYRSTISWQQAARNTDTVLFPSPLEPISADDTVNTLLWNTVAVRQLGRSRLSAGYELGVVGSTLEDEAESKSSLTTARLDATQNSSALFAEAFIPVSNFELRPGMRLEYLSSHDRYGDFTANDIGTSATMAALYRWTEERALYLTTSSAYRNPTLSERFYAGRIIGAADPGILRGDSGISGERGNSIEAGLKETTAYHSMRLAGFYSRINNYIGIDSQSGDEEGVVRELQYRNFTAVSVRGVEAEASYQVLDEVQLFGNIAQSWSSSAERMDLPALIANYGLRYQQDLCDCTSLKQFTGTIYARSVGSSTDRTSAVIVERFPSGESFSTLNFEGALEFAPLPVGDLTLLFGARNLANTRYREPFYNQLQPGLTGYVALTLAY
jgi:outer membrane receptor protein involved in Fe transport